MKRITFKTSPLSNAIRIGLLVWILGIIVFKIDTTKLIFKKSAEELKGPNITNTMTTEQYAEVLKLAKEQLTEKPPQQTPEVQPSTTNENETSIEVRTDNRIYVPVTIGYRGKMVTVPLLIDTGATDITISPAIARRLGISGEETTTGESTVADGRKVAHYKINAAFVAVGPKTKKPLQVHIMPTVNNEETGLLGMSFLADFPHMLDLRSQVIRWM